MLKKIIIIAGLSFAPCHVSHGLEQLKQTKEDIKKAKEQLAQTGKDLKGSYVDQEKMLIQIGDVLPMITQYKDMTETFYPVAETLRVVLIANTGNPILAPIAIPVLVLAGDIPDIMRTLKNLLGSIHSTLTIIENTIRPKAQYLNSGPLVKCAHIIKDGQGGERIEKIEVVSAKTCRDFQGFQDNEGNQHITYGIEVVAEPDPKGLYKQLDVAQQAFGDVENKLDQIITGLARVAAGVRGKPAAQQLIIEEE